MQKQKELIAIIENWESGKHNITETLNDIFVLTGKQTDEYTLRTYWTTNSLEDLCEIFLTEPINDWEAIDDERAKRLIKEIFDNLGNDGIISRNEEALEKKYKKPSGFVIDLIFQQDLEIDGILSELKKDTTIYL
jgi:hypothetical protein